MIDPKIKDLLGFKPDEDVLAKWKTASTRVCKPCWELKYCPYGPFVEEFPLLPLTLKEAEEHLEYSKRCLETGVLGNGEQMNDERRKMFEEEIAEFNPDKISERDT